MMYSDVNTGGWLCGGVRYEIRGELRPVVYCHCEQCRKTSGHFVAATTSPLQAFALLNDETLSVYRASDVARRGFCNRCGGNLFRSPDNEDRICIYAGTIDTPTGLSDDRHIFVADKSDYVDIVDGVPQFDQAG